MANHNAGMTNDPVEDDVRAVRDYFDTLGAGEWERLVQAPSARVALELHRRFLARFIRPGSRVLEIGAGPGRFTVELAALGASVVVSDISAVQLELDRLAADPAVWPQFLDWEEELAQEPGMLDGGTHILFAIEHL